MEALLLQRVFHARIFNLKMLKNSTVLRLIISLSLPPEIDATHQSIARSEPARELPFFSSVASVGGQVCYPKTAPGKIFGRNSYEGSDALSRVQQKRLKKLR